MASPLRHTKHGELKKPQVLLNKRITSGPIYNSSPTKSISNDNSNNNNIHQNENRISNHRSNSGLSSDWRSFSSRSYLNASPVRDLGSPIRMKTTTPRASSLTSRRDNIFNSISNRDNASKGGFTNANGNGNATNGKDVAFSERDKYYTQQIEKQEQKLREIIEQIKENSAKLNNLYSDKVSLSANKTKLKHQLRELEAKFQNVDKELEYNNEIQNRKLELEVEKLNISYKEKEHAMRRRINEIRTACEGKLKEAQLFNSTQTLSEIQHLKSNIAELRHKIETVTRKNNLLIEDKENHLNEEYNKKQQEMERRIALSRETLEAKRLQIDQEKQTLDKIMETYYQGRSKIEQLEELIRNLETNKLSTTEVINELNSEIGILRNRNSEKQNVVNEWEIEFNKYQASNNEVLAKLKKEKFLKRRTEFAIQSLLEKLRVYVRILYSSDATSYDNTYSSLSPYHIRNENNGIEQLTINNESFTVSKIFKPLSDDEMCEEFDCLLEESFKCLNTSVMIIGDQTSHKYGPFLLLLLKKNFEHLKKRYVEKLQPRGWSFNFSFQCLAISATDNKFMDMLANKNRDNDKNDDNNGNDSDQTKGTKIPETQQNKQEETTIFIGKRDIVSTSTIIPLSLAKDNTLAFSEIREMQIPANSVPFLLFHIKGNNSSLQKSVNSTSFTLDFTLSNNKNNHHQDLSIITQIFDDVVSTIAQNKYQSSIYKDDELFLKQLVHSLYANTESITTLNISSENLNSEPFGKMLQLGNKINSVASPPKKRAIRGL